MNDPRIEGILGHAGRTDGQGRPTELAVVAARIKDHIDAVDELRVELDEVEGGIMDAESRAQVLAESLTERAGHRTDLQYEAQDTAVRAALSGSSAGAAQLRNQAARKQRNIAEFERDFAEDQKRLDHAKESLRSRQSRIKQIRDQIARRMNTIDMLLQRAEVSWPAEIRRRRNAAVARPGARKPGARPAPRRMARPPSRGSARRVVIRRRQAS